MRIVKKADPGSPLNTVRELSAQERQALIDMFVKKNPKLSFFVRQRIIALLRESHERGWWLECDCKKLDKPLLTIVRSENNALFLKRINSRGLHADNCVFKGIEYEKYTSASHSVKTPFQPDKVLHLHKNFADTISKIDSSSEQHKGTTSISDSYPTLARILFSFISGAKLNKVSLPVLTVTDQYQALHNIVKKFKLELDVNAADFFWTYPKQITFAATKLREAKKSWPDNSRPYALFVMIADAIDNNTIVCKSQDEDINISFSGNLIKSSGRLGERSAPYLAIFTVTEGPNKPGWYEPFNAYLIPVCSKRFLVPVDSYYERKVLLELINWLNWWNKKGIKVEIEKPLFDMLVATPDNKQQGVKPDFIVRSQTKTIILEVMGSHEIEYKERKKRVLPLMAKFGELLEFDALASEANNSLDEDIKKLAKRISGILLKDK